MQKLNNFYSKLKSTMSGSIKKEVSFTKNIKTRKNIPGMELLRLMYALEELKLEEESIFQNERALKMCIDSKEERFDTYLP